MIARNHPARNAVAELSSGSYYANKTDCVVAVGLALQRHGFKLDDSADFDGDNGSSNVEFYTALPALSGGTVYGDPAGYVHFAWYRMPSGRYELTVYVT